jgi:hypothetical protein
VFLDPRRSLTFASFFFQKQKLTNAAAKGGKVFLVYEYVRPLLLSVDFRIDFGISNGSGFYGIDVGNFTAALIQAVDGEFVSQALWTGDRDYSHLLNSWSNNLLQEYPSPFHSHKSAHPPTFLILLEVSSPHSPGKLPPFSH